MNIKNNPMAMTERAATRSPIILILRVSREAEIPTVNKAGTVPKPKANMVIAPSAQFSVMAALMSMEVGKGARQESAGRPNGYFRNGTRPLPQGGKKTVPKGLEGH